MYYNNCKFQGYGKIINEMHEKNWQDRMDEFKKRPKSKL